MGLVESKPESGIPISGDKKPTSEAPELKKAHPIIIVGSGRITTNIPGHQDDDFAIVDPSINAKSDTRALARESAYGLLDRKDVPANLASGLRKYRSIRRRKQKDKSKRVKPPKYAPFEDPPETELT